MFFLPGKNILVGQEDKMCMTLAITQVLIFGKLYFFHYMQNSSNFDVFGIMILAKSWPISIFIHIWGRKSTYLSSFC